MAWSGWRKNLEEDAVFRTQLGLDYAALPSAHLVRLVPDQDDQQKDGQIRQRHRAIRRLSDRSLAGDGLDRHLNGRQQEGIRADRGKEKEGLVRI